MMNINDLVQINLRDNEDFLKIKETLTRIGIASSQDNTLYQSCHILHKQGNYYIVHFKQMFLLDGKNSDFSEDDRARLNTIANLLHDWELYDLLDEDKTSEPTVPIKDIKILSFKEKANWKLVAKYQIGKKKE
tara:strand:+ start:10928 stop:11326 length:399 start_codon:yes stop_codon:yes gene_type:complete